jgi:hypothetical protein
VIGLYTLILIDPDTGEIRRENWPAKLSDALIEDLAALPPVPLSDEEGGAGQRWCPRVSQDSGTALRRSPGPRSGDPQQEQLGCDPSIRRHLHHRLCLPMV